MQKMSKNGSGKATVVLNASSNSGPPPVAANSLHNNQPRTIDRKTWTSEKTKRSLLGICASGLKNCSKKFANAHPSKSGRSMEPRREAISKGNFPQNLPDRLSFAFLRSLYQYSWQSKHRHLLWWRQVEWWNRNRVTCHRLLGHPPPTDRATIRIRWGVAIPYNSGCHVQPTVKFRPIHVSRETTETRPTPSTGFASGAIWQFINKKKVGKVNSRTARC